MKYAGPDDSLGLAVQLNLTVEPNWVLTEESGSSTATARPGGPPLLVAATTEATRITVLRLISVALSTGYGDDPTTSQLSAQDLTLNAADAGAGQVTGYEVVTQIAINPQYRAENDLKVKTERLWVLGVPIGNRVSIFLMSIPDDRQELWSKAQAIVAGVRRG